MAVPENQLIALLPRRDQASLIAACESVRLVPGAVLGEPGEVTRHAYFPTDCAISLVTAKGGEPGLEVGLVGREGMLGVQLVLGVGVMPLHALVQGAGTARRIGAERFRRVLSTSRALQRSLQGYVHVLMVQLATSAACTRFHHVEPRLARWLLMTQDRALSDTFHLTHEILGHMLGVRRVGITGAARDLQRLGLIRYHRGLITVLDRAGLEARACSCYAANRHAYDTTIGVSASIVR
jgi:CRP-like cAMP-binding protein